MKQFNFTYRLLMVYLIVQIPIGCLKSQEFSIPIYFEDAKGNKDTIIYGLDEIGTKDMDTIFREKNIIDVPINKELDVRITDELYQRHFNDSTGQFHTKKQIVSNADDIFYHAIDIVSRNFPVTASWDMTTLINQNRAAGITSIAPGGRWDTGSPSGLVWVSMRQQNEITFSPNNPDGEGKEEDKYAYGYVNSANDTVSTYWLIFGLDKIVNVEETELEQAEITLIPNPAATKISVKTFNQENIENILIFDNNGVLVKRTNQTEIEITNLDKGIYWVKCVFKDTNRFQTKSFVKK